MVAETKRKARGKKTKQADAEPQVIDPRAAIEPTKAALEATMAELRTVLAGLPAPAEPTRTDLIDALIHIEVADGLPCGIGQEARLRIWSTMVDRNELRVSEAFELEELLADLALPDAFARCDRVIEAVRQIYNECNDVNLDFLREAQVSERTSFFQRTPGISAAAARFLTNLLAMEEVAFSDRSTLRVQQRLGLEPKSKPVETFVAELREVMAPYGGLPLDVTGGGDVQPRRAAKKPALTPVLSPACLLVRLAPPGKR